MTSKGPQTTTRTHYSGKGTVVRTAWGQRVLERTIMHYNTKLAREQNEKELGWARH